MTRTISMNTLAPGEKGTVLSILTPGPMRRRLQELGLTAGSPVECVGRSPGGDPSDSISISLLRDPDGLKRTA